jgi:hypothetical protein
MTMEERRKLVEAVKWVDEVVLHAPCQCAPTRLASPLGLNDSLTIFIWGC